MSYWALGVGVPIKNRAFRFGTYKESQLATAYTSGLTLHVNSDLRNYFGTSDYVVIGPSSDSSHVGKSETGKITAINASNIIVVDSSLEYNYATNDYISGVGNRIAAGWVPQTNYSDGFYCLGFDNDGKNHNSAQLIKMVEDTMGTDPTEGKIRQTIDANIINASKVYRFGFYYKFTVNLFLPGLYVTVNDGSSNYINAIKITQNDVNSWTLYTKTATTSSGAGSSDGYIDIYVKGADSADPHSGSAYIDQVFMEHAIGTTDESSGVYTFTEYPEMGSRMWERISPLARVTLRNNETRIYDSSGMSGKQYLHKVTAQFDNVSSDFYENLLTLMNYQLEGNFLVFHHDIEKIPPTLYGLMGLTGFRNNMWDNSRVSFTFTFEEIS